MQLRIRTIFTGIFVLLLSAAASVAQVTGGKAAFEFLRMPQSPHITALGGISVSNPAQDISLAIQNPSLMRPALHNQLSVGYNSYYAGIGVANLQYGYHFEKIQTSFVGGIQYLNYGNFKQTDASGNELGSFRANDFAISIGASRSYLTRWRYGAAVKLAYSSLYDKKAMAVLADVGATYYDTSRLITVAIAAKNMGSMIKKYSASNPAEPMPFDLQIGFSKRFAHLPLRVSATAHHLYEWDVRYNNPADVERNSLFGTTDTSTGKKNYFADKLFRHLIFSADLMVGNRITITAGYNHLRRGELGLKEKTALAGFSFGGTVNLNKIQVQYARSYYHVAGAYNEFGLNLHLNQMTGIGKKTESWKWNAVYPDWKQ